MSARKKKGDVSAVGYMKTSDLDFNERVNNAAEVARLKVMLVVDEQTARMTSSVKRAFYVTLLATLAVEFAEVGE